MSPLAARLCIVGNMLPTSYELNGPALERIPNEKLHFIFYKVMRLGLPVLRRNTSMGAHAENEAVPRNTENIVWVMKLQEVR